ncbi:4964_t:CDS:2 [Diversispora eburnea]|uniref:4964_t:CDS:1 n=1 Tax=Diversispora eburnea TaxID=1213867 RepID=A0A9N8V9L8_9GLOM|nr:4964_t:CDS:2 [Diversispora eburnea]
MYTLELIRARLKQTFKENPKYHLKCKEIINDAAPLCIANGKPSVLFTIRSQNLKTHKGEVSFPGGKKDPTDQSLEITALRETFEEIRILPKDIDILVSGVFTMTLNELLNPKIRTFRQFRNTKIEYPVYQAPSWVKLEIWGLTAFILNSVLKKLTDSPLKKK